MLKKMGKKNRGCIHNLSEGGAMKRTCLMSFYLPLALLLLIGVGTGHGAVTGKISGIVKDAKEGDAALVGANVIVQGTTLGAATDANGQYTILNVPPGVYEIRFSMMGYQDAIIQGVQVKIDLTTNIDMALNPTVIESGEVVTVGTGVPPLRP